ncbi:HK97-gp10 family putative phage morphogenesis protein [Acinetobacter baumannii]|uniref:HK97-gp10 family putative phage morphogenesis protein n=1 Tax=Acinetobacter baumannii TaxID=470 RepID=UPI000BF55D13|nr:HK97-gp10 family putative phage morphogenesis protein [Acinetobacter baumannii]
MSVEVRIEGLPDLENKLRQLADEKKVKKITRQAARKAMNIVRNAARENAKRVDNKKTSEKIWKNISTQAGKTRNSRTIKMRVGVRGGASFSDPNPPETSGGDTRHWRWVEFGSSHQPAIPFMRPALANNIEKVTTKFSESFSEALNLELVNL